MTNNTKARSGCNQASPHQSNHTSNPTNIAPVIKVVIVTLALKGLLPVGAANWIIQRGGLRHV